MRTVAAISQVVEDVGIGGRASQATQASAREAYLCAIMAVLNGVYGTTWPMYLAEPMQEAVR